MRSHDRRPGAREQARVDLGQRGPLHVEDVPAAAPKADETDEVLDCSKRQAQPRPPEQASAERVEELDSAVAGRLVALTEAKLRRQELDVEIELGERTRQMVVVGRREGRRIKKRYTQAAGS